MSSRIDWDLLPQSGLPPRRHLLGMVCALPLTGALVAAVAVLSQLVTS